MPLRLPAEEEQADKPGRTPKHKREPDRFLLLVKTATIVVAAAIVGGLILALNSGDGPRAEDPEIPEITSPTQRGDRALEQRETTTTQQTTLAPPPETATATTEIAPQPPPQQPPPVVVEPPPTDNPGFAVVGGPCDPGTFSLTADYQPVVCSDGTWQPLGR